MEKRETSGLPISGFRLRIYEDAEAKAKGIVKQEVIIKNKMTNASLAVITGLLGNTGAQVAFTYLAVGTSSTAVSAAHTALQAEITTLGLGRAAATMSRTTTSQTNDTLNLVYEWTASGSTTIQEVGIFNDPTTGVMLARALTGSVAVATGNKVDATYTWQAVGN